MRHKNVRGKISALTERDGKPFERGREWFSITYHEDGQRTVRAQCELDDRQLLRDVVYTLTSDFKPADCFIRLHRAGKFLGTGWCRFQDKFAECEVFNAETGRISQRIPLSSPLTGFGTHPVTCDALLLRAFDHSKPEKVQKADGVLMSSLQHDGSSGPMLSPISFGIEYLGRDEVTTPVGTFEADKYQFLLDGSFPEEHPTEEIWCIPETLMFVKVRVGGYINTTFELVEYEEL
jgi:hypothetical protein